MPNATHTSGWRSSFQKKQPPGGVMAWEGSNRHTRLPTNWPTIRARILRRDNHHCQIRGPRCEINATEVDHIQAGDNHQPTNLQAACPTCHATKSGREGAAAQRPAAPRRRPPQPHPGELR